MTIAEGARLHIIAVTVAITLTSKSERSGICQNGDDWRLLQQKTLGKNPNCPLDEEVDYEADDNEDGRPEADEREDERVVRRQMREALMIERLLWRGDWVHTNRVGRSCC